MDYVQQSGQPQQFAEAKVVQGVGAPTPPTLVRALSSLDELNKRLVTLRSQAEEIAQAVGGPYPTNPSGNKAEGLPQSAMQRLNASVDDAHALIDTVEHALGAIRRSLGS